MYVVHLRKLSADTVHLRMLNILCCPLTYVVHLCMLSTYVCCPLTYVVHLCMLSTYVCCPLTYVVHLRKLSADTVHLRMLSIYVCCPLTYVVRPERRDDPEHVVGRLVVIGDVRRRVAVGRRRRHALLKQLADVRQVAHLTLQLRKHLAWRRDTHRRVTVTDTTTSLRQRWL